ncbi:MAG: hypothetical protein WCT22_00165 [Patescibacteria group bacterium]
MAIEHRSNHPYFHNPAFLAGRIDRFEVQSKSFTKRLPALLYLGLDHNFNIWRETGFPLLSGFPSLLGHDPNFIGLKHGQVGANLSFSLWYQNKRASEYNEPYQPEFESKVAAQLSNFFLQRIANISGNNSQTELAALITGIQLVSTNLIDSPEYVLTYLQKKYGSLNIFSNFPSYIFDIVKSFTNDDRELISNIFQLFFNHEKAYFDGFESSVFLPKKLLEAFFNIVGSEKACTGYSDHSHIDEDLVTPMQVANLVERLNKEPSQYYPDEDLRVQFASRYIVGLKGVAQAMIEGKKNGVTYLYDHLKRTMENNGLLPKDIKATEVKEWEEILLSCLKDPQLFDFLHEDNKVREIVGRYDYRSLVNYFKKEGKKNISVISLGFGKLGAATWEMEGIFLNSGIKMDINGVDILPLKSANQKPDDILVERYTRTDSGILRDGDGDNMPDIETLTMDEKQGLITWYNNLQKGGKLIGKINLINDSPNIPKADLVTLQGTVACLRNYNDRVKMIENALKLVNPNGGILLVEGGMTLTGGQNVRSIAIRLNKGKPEIVYIEIDRSRDVIVPSSYVSSNKTLIANTDVYTGNGQLNQGENYISVSFSEEEIVIPVLFSAINNSKLI